jgi:FXSXX-COOH protein
VDPAASLTDSRSDVSLISDVRDVPLADLASLGSSWNAVAAAVVTRVADATHGSSLPPTMVFNSAI